MICFRCPYCGHRIKAADESAGRIGQCKCGERVCIPNSNPFERAVDDRDSSEAVRVQPEAPMAPWSSPPSPYDFSPLSPSDSIDIASTSNNFNKNRNRAGLLIGLTAGGSVVVILAFALVIAMRDRDPHTEKAPASLLDDNGESTKTQLRPKPESLRGDSSRVTQLRPKPESLRGFVIIAKQIRTGISEGISYKDFEEKQTKLRDAFALIDKGDFDTEVGRRAKEAFESAKELRKIWFKHIYESNYVSWEGLLRIYMRDAGEKMDRFLSAWEGLGIK